MTTRTERLMIWLDEKHPVLCWLILSLLAVVLGVVVGLILFGIFLLTD